MLLLDPPRQQGDQLHQPPVHFPEAGWLYPPETLFLGCLSGTGLFEAIWCISYQRLEIWNFPNDEKIPGTRDNQWEMESDIERINCARSLGWLSEIFCFWHCKNGLTPEPGAECMRRRGEIGMQIRVGAGWETSIEMHPTPPGMNTSQPAAYRRCWCRTVIPGVENRGESENFWSKPSLWAVPSILAIPQQSFSMYVDPPRTFHCFEKRPTPPLTNATPTETLKQENDWEITPYLEETHFMDLRLRLLTCNWFEKGSKGEEVHWY